MHYFAYCTWLNDPEIRRYMPKSRLVTKGYAANHRLQFHAAAGRDDRGWCHLNGLPDAWGEKCLGLVFEDDGLVDDYDDFERFAITVHGDDGKAYDCWTYRMTDPGMPMRPPNFYWQHIPDGLKAHRFPPEYIAKVQAMYDAAAPCPRADRPNPSAIPGKSAATR
ncbi:MAG TPA: gamma-glutamylcyclotransferase [Burkholderiaceae bacterium]|nr:gamma-glutamylcyclotransferase [Burkholderiaceae bacterium]